MKGHQPFFFLAAGFALLEIGIWLGTLLAGFPMAVALPPAQWHAHEMLFGYVPAVLAGFLLSSTTGWRIIFLSAMWLAGRIAMTAEGILPQEIIAAVDLAFPLALVTLRMPALWISFKWPTIGFVPLLGALFVANLLWHLDALALLPGAARNGELLAVDLYSLMMVVMAGRLVPGYTRAMSIPVSKPKDPARETASVAVGLALLMSDQLEWKTAVGVSAFVLGALQLWRLAGWRTVEVFTRPVLLVLHLGFAWLTLGLLLRGTAGLSDWISEVDAIHVITVGAIGTLTLGMMGRLTQTHARRAAGASLPDIAAYALMLASALARSILPGLFPDERQAVIAAAGALWMLAFALFLIEHGSALLRRQERKS
jgi:uncharacterized protein involved in response to NO